MQPVSLKEGEVLILIDETRDRIITITKHPLSPNGVTMSATPLETIKESK